MNKSINITTKTANIKIGPLGFLEYGKDFYKAFSAYKPDQKYPPSSYYLICRAIELSFKSYLLTHGIEQKQLKSKSLGHNLEKILRKSKELHIDSVVEISDIEVQNLKKANRWYDRKGFEYFVIRNIFENKDTLPDLKVLEELVKKLFIKLKPVCLEASKD